MDRRVWYFGLLAVVVMGSRGAQKVEYIEEGGQLNLKPTTPAVALSSVLWKIGPDMVAEWVKSLGPVDYYGQFKGRTSLNNVTGQLEINALTSADNGVYSVEVNGKLQSKTYNFKVIRKVSKPMVSLKPLACSSTSDFCTLSCDGGIPEAEPITYSWRLDRGEWKQSSELMNITKDDSANENFSCRMKNPLNEEESEPEKNPFHQAGSSNVNVGAIIGGIFPLIVIGGVVICYLKCDVIRKKISSLRNSTGNTGNQAEQTPLQGGQTPSSGDIEQGNQEKPATPEEKETTNQHQPCTVESADQEEPAPPGESAEEKEPLNQNQPPKSESADQEEPATPDQSDGQTPSGLSGDEQGIPSEEQPPNQPKDGDSNGKT